MTTRHYGRYPILRLLKYLYENETSITANDAYQYINSKSKHPLQSAESFITMLLSNHWIQPLNIKSPGKTTSRKLYCISDKGTLHYLENKKALEEHDRQK